MEELKSDSFEKQLQSKLFSRLNIAHLNILNESHLHGSSKSGNSHFMLVVVSEDFVGKSKVLRHRLIYDILADELKGPVHALSLRLFTIAEWDSVSKEVMPSPNCVKKQ